ncbi:MAG: hypothetical protein H8E18_02245 [FCB group bacterium]|nr:hypothetical protein [FCB group bacterium]
MKTKAITPEQFEAIGADLRDAFAMGSGGLRTIAASIAPPIYDEIRQKEIASLLLTENKLPKGEPARYAKIKEVQAFWIATGGQVHRSDLNDDEIEFPVSRVASNPAVDVSVLRNGDVHRLTDMEKWAGSAIRKKLNQRVVKVISEAVPVANTVEIGGTSLTEAGLNQAISLLEDKDLTVKYIVLRGGRFNDMRGWELDPVTERELREKGILKYFSGAQVLTTSAAKMDEIILIPDEPIGKMAIRTPIAVEPDNRPSEFKVSWVVWMELALGVLRPDMIAKVKILG